MRVRLVLGLMIAALLSGCAGGLPIGVVYPSIEPVAGQPTTVTRSFTFEGEPVTLTAIVDSGVYEGAAAAEKSVTRFGNARESDWIEDYYPAFVDEKHQSAFYDSVLAATRAVRDAKALDSDRYAELLTVFVQSLTYETDPVDLSPKFPIETFVDGEGDCDDKTLLLAGLLSREGYDVAIMLFEAEEHVALGIRSSALGYAGTAYAFIETTTPGYIGMVPETLADGASLSSTPRLFRIGSGSSAYTAGGEVRTILDTRDRAVREADVLSSRITAADAEISTLNEQARAESARLEGLRTSGRVTEYNAAVPAFNRLVDRHNEALRARDGLVSAYNQLVDLETIVVNGVDDRLGTYAAIAGRL